MLTEAEKRTRRCCFTGHRPQKIKQSPDYIRARLEERIRVAIDAGYTVFITGMAPGVDIWAAQIVLHLRDKGYPVRLICAVPFKGFEERWSLAWREQYQEILNDADLVKYICPSYSKDCFQIRNEWMVDHAARVIAVYNGEPSGTRNTIKYAHTQSVPIDMIEI